MDDLVSEMKWNEMNIEVMNWILFLVIRLKKEIILVWIFWLVCMTECSEIWLNW